MTKQHSLNRKLGISKQLVNECLDTIQESILHGQSDPISGEDFEVINRLVFKLSREIKAIEGFWDSIALQKSNWPSYPEEIIKQRADHDSWNGVNVDLVSVPLYRAHGVCEMLSLCLNTEAKKRLDANTLTEVVSCIMGDLEIANHLIDAAIAEQGDGNE